MHASDPSASQQFGRSLALESGVVLVGARLDSEHAQRAGAAYVDDLDACLGTAYRVGAPNSAGPGALVYATGSSVVADNDFTLSVQGCPRNVPGLFYYGPTQIQVPFGEGFRCVGGSVTRLAPPIFVDGQGAGTRQVDLALPPAVSTIVPGATLNFQFWYRDNPGGSSGFNLSNATSITWQ